MLLPSFVRAREPASILYSSALCLGLLFSLSLEAISVEKTMQEVTSSPIRVDLRNPSYHDGVLETKEGGVITAKDLRIQGDCLRYMKKGGESITEKVAVEGNVSIEFKEKIFVGKTLQYDFRTRKGIITRGRTAVGAWFMGGETVEIYGNGSYKLYKGFLTTSDHADAEWEIRFEETTLAPNRDFVSSQVQFSALKTPLMRLPRLKANLDDISEMPLRLYTSWGGKLGHRMSLSYKLFSRNRWKNVVRFDYRMQRGPGIALETRYRSEDIKRTFRSVSFVAKDSSVDDPKEKMRYRFQGSYADSLCDDKVTVHCTYDKLSDEDMATDYNHSGIDIKYAGLTQLKMRRQEEDRISNFFATVRVNNFQTLKQELPTWEVRYKPVKSPLFGMIYENRCKVAYLNLKYAEEFKHHRGYESIRLEYYHRFYRKYGFDIFTFIPEISAKSIYYNTPRRGSRRLLITGLFNGELNTSLHKTYCAYKHSVTPYARYTVSPRPTLQPDDHYIFDIEDGLSRLNMVRWGVRQRFAPQDIFSEGKELSFDLYGNHCFDEQSKKNNVPKIYFDIACKPQPRIRSRWNIAWNIRNSRLDHFNICTEWTLCDDIAVAAEFRRRTSFAWRKVDVHNFMLESARSERELLHSSLSDRRDTFLLRLFYRLSPLWVSEFEVRHGRNRKHEPNYTELEVDLIGTIHRAWQCRFSYQRRENDHHRFAVYVNFGCKVPKACSKK